MALACAIKLKIETAQWADAGGTYEWNVLKRMQEPLHETHTPDGIDIR